MRAHLSLPATAVLAVLLVCFGIAVRAGVLIEDLQLLFFPLTVAVLWYVPKRRSERVPLPLLSLAAVLWLSTTAHFNGFITISKGNTVPVSRLDGDGSSLHARSLFQRFNVIARTYHLLRAELIHRSFVDDKEARAWLAEKHPDGPFLIRGTTEWLRLVFRRDLNPYLAMYPRLREEQHPEEAHAEAAAAGLEIGRDVIVARAPDGSRVAVVFQPEAIQVADAPTELSRHFLAWLGKGLESPKPSARPDAELESRRDALKEARLISGAWRSKAPLGLAAYLLGTLDLLEALDSGRRSPQLLRSARRYLEVADHYVDVGREPALTAALYNNLAVVRLLQAESEKSARKARRFFHLALKQAGPETAPRGSRAALLNLTLEARPAS